MIRAIGLTKQFRDGNRAINAVDLEVAKGEIFGLLGPNGSGKTTTLNLFLDFIRPTRGRALINDIEVAREPLRAKRYVELIPENVALYPTLTAAQNVEFFSSVGLKKTPRRDRVREALLRVGLMGDVVDRRVSTFSKGMRQRAGLAVALVRQAPAVLLDEPTAGLDPKAATDFVDLLVGMRREGTAILLCTHDLFRAQQVCDRVGILREGTMQATLDRQQLNAADLERLYLEVMAQPNP